MIKASIPLKLSLAMLFFLMASLSLMAMFTYRSINNGFSAYLSEVELSKLEPVVAAIEKQYQDNNKSWLFVQENPRRFWSSMRAAIIENITKQLEETTGGEQPKESIGLPIDLSQSSADDNSLQAPGPPFEGPPSQNQFAGPPPPFDSPPPPQKMLGPGGHIPGRPAPGQPILGGPVPGDPGSRLNPSDEQLLRRVAIFDSSGNLLFGPPAATASLVSIKLFNNKNQIGILKIMPSSRIEQELFAGFLIKLSKQLSILIAIASIVSALLLYQFARIIFKPMNTLLKSTKALASGDLSKRVDISSNDEFGQLAGNLNSLATVLEENEHAHKSWVADTSHELRTPIAILQAQVEAFQDGVQEVNEKTLSVLHSEVISLSKLVDDLHDLARSDIGQLTYSKVPVEPLSVLQEVIESYEELLAEKNIILEVDDKIKLGPQERLIVKGDAYRLKQLFTNILENSRRYTDKNGKVKITKEFTNNTLNIKVEDSLPNVPEHLLPKIFERFYRTESSRNRSLAGSGLGLSICKSIVESHGGKIQAKSSTLGGLCIEITLPTNK